MNTNGKGLGRGLDALFNSQPTQADNTVTIPDSPFRYIETEMLLPNPSQPREIFSEESLQELADSIHNRGILQPILVRPAKAPGKWQIIAGERRWRAAKMAGLASVPVVVRDLNDSDAMIVAVMENIHREDLNPLEKARGLKAIQTALNISQVDLANYLGLQRGTVNNLLRLLTLPPETQEALLANKITFGHAKSIASLPEEAGNALRERVIGDGMSVRGTELATAAWQRDERFPWDKLPAEKGERRQIDPNILKLARQIGQTLNCQARITGTAEKGKINLTYDSNEQLFDLLERLGLSLQP